MELLRYEDTTYLSESLWDQAFKFQHWNHHFPEYFLKIKLRLEIIIFKYLNCENISHPPNYVASGFVNFFSFQKIKEWTLFFFPLQ